MATINATNYQSSDFIVEAFNAVAEDIQLRAIQIADESIDQGVLRDKADDLILDAEQQFCAKVKPFVKEEGVYLTILIQELTDNFFTYNCQQHLIKLLSNQSKELVSLQ